MAALGLAGFGLACSDAATTAPARPALAPSGSPAADIAQDVNLTDVTAKVTGPDVFAHAGSGTYTVKLTGSQTMQPLDVIIVLDASGSISTSAFNTAKNALNGLVDNFAWSSSGNRLGIVEFSTTTSTRYALNALQTPTALHSAINALPYLAQSTYTKNAIDTTIADFRAWGRVNARRVMLLITDGVPNPTSQSPCGLKTTLDAENVETLIFGIGSQFTTSALSCIVNSSSQFKLLSGYSDLSASLNASIVEVATPHNVSYTAQLPIGFTFGATTVTTGSVSFPQPNVATWTVGDLPATEQTFTYVVNASATACGSQLVARQSVSYGHLGTLNSSYLLPVVSATFPACDNSGPVVTPTVTGTKGDNDWYTSDVTVHWSVVDADSPVTSSTGCADVTLTTDTNGTTYTCTATSDGGTTTQSVLVKRDAALPTAGVAVGGTLGANGWYRGDVTLAWSHGAGLSGEAVTGCVNTTITDDVVGYVASCTVKNGAGVTATKTVTINRDATAPTLTPTVSGTGANGWFSSNVGVHWAVGDETSGIATTEGCGDVSVTSNTAGTTYACAASDAAGNTSTQSVTVKRDGTVPSVTPSVSGTLGANGWYVSNVGVSFATTYGISGAGATSGCAATTLTTDGSATFTCTATSLAGLSTSAAAAVKRDATVPAIAFGGNAGTYSIDQNVNITCQATDATSGIDASATTCPGASGAAYLLGVGAHTLSASARDNAGNAVTASASFTVSVTCGAIGSFVNAWVTKEGTVNSLRAKLTNVCASSGNARAGQIGAFINEVQAQTGKAIPADKAALLIQFIQAL